MAARRHHVIDSTLAELALVLVFVFAMVAVGVAAARQSEPCPPPTAAGGELGKRELFGDLFKLPLQGYGWPEPPAGRLLGDALSFVTQGGKNTPCLIFRRGERAFATAPYGATYAELVKQLQRAGAGSPQPTEAVERSLLAFQVNPVGTVTVAYNLGEASPHDPSLRKGAYFYDDAVRGALSPSGAAGGGPGALIALLDRTYFANRLTPRLRAAGAGPAPLRATLAAPAFETATRDFLSGLGPVRASIGRCTLHGDYYNEGVLSRTAPSGAGWVGQVSVSLQRLRDHGLAPNTRFRDEAPF